MKFLNDLYGRLKKQNSHSWRNTGASTSSSVSVSSACVLTPTSPKRTDTMKVTVHDILVNCPKHGKVPYTASSDLGGKVVTMYCPPLRGRSAPAAPAPSLSISNSGHLTIRYRDVQSRGLRIAHTDSLSIVAQTFQFVHSCRHR